MQPPQFFWNFLSRLPQLTSTLLPEFLLPRFIGFVLLLLSICGYTDYFGIYVSRVFQGKEKLIRKVIRFYLQNILK